MGIYSANILTVNQGAATPAVELLTTSTDKPRILSIEINPEAALGGVLGLGIPGAAGIGALSYTTLLPEDPADPNCTVKYATQWSTGPTVPSNYFRRASFPTFAAMGIIWQFPKGLIMAANTSMVLWNIAAGDVFDVRVIMEI